MINYLHGLPQARWCRSVLAVASMALLTLGGCGKGAPAQADSRPKEIVFSILSAENQQSMGPLWDPLLADLSKATGVKVKPFFASNYTALIEAMRFNQVQLGWFSALPAVEAVDRSEGEVIGRVISGDGTLGYSSILIVKKGSGIKLADVLACGKRYSFGIGDAKSTSGTLAPLYYLFSGPGIEPADCFKTVRSANHQTNLASVANGLVDVATNNTEGLKFARAGSDRRGEAVSTADQVDVIWTSPPLPESGIVVRKDLDPELKEKIRSFFLTYGTAPGAEGDRQRKIMEGLTYRGFAAADNSYLDPVRAMVAANQLREARKGGDTTRIRAAESALADIQGRLAAQPAPAPEASTVH